MQSWEHFLRYCMVYYLFVVVSLNSVDCLDAVCNLQNFELDEFQLMFDFTINHYCHFIHWMHLDGHWYQLILEQLLTFYMFKLDLLVSKYVVNMLESIKFLFVTLYYCLMDLKEPNFIKLFIFMPNHERKEKIWYSYQIA